MGVANRNAQRVKQATKRNRPTQGEKAAGTQGLKAMLIELSVMVKGVPTCAV